MNNEITATDAHFILVSKSTQNVAHMTAIYWHMAKSIANDSALRQNQKASCADIKKSAFESHTNCYVKCDFCRVCKSDKWNLIGSYDYSDFFSWTAIKQVLSVLAHCGGPWKCFT
ncbi:hypothetical protein Tcan_01871 [Toxocara canis]|uniref:Uncharacterized protein n=1 Tax=Toxocara canis TaxID=6265 RepID=A0A0B2UR21_TOXCA|nr:hypothetical protein Tcan_01871 [Toxocara canis]